MLLLLTMVQFDFYNLALLHDCWRVMEKNVFLVLISYCRVEVRYDFDTLPSCVHVVDVVVVVVACLMMTLLIACCSSCCAWVMPVENTERNDLVMECCCKKQA